MSRQEITAALQKIILIFQGSHSARKASSETRMLFRVLAFHRMTSGEAALEPLAVRWKTSFSRPGPSRAGIMVGGVVTQPAARRFLPGIHPDLPLKFPPVSRLERRSSCHPVTGPGCQIPEPCQGEFAAVQFCGYPDRQHQLVRWRQPGHLAKRV